MRVLIFSFLLLPFAVHAQVAMDDFLNAALDASSIKSLDDQTKFLDTEPYRMAPVRSMQLRTETNQLDPERQDFALRLSPANPWEVKRNNEYFRTYQKVLRLDRQRELKKLLKNRYSMIIEWAYHQERKKLRQETYALGKTMIQILEGQRFSDYFDANDYAELKIDQIETLVILEELNFEEEEQRAKIASIYPAASTQQILWSLGDMIATVDMIEKIENDVSTTAIGELAYRQKKIELARSEWALEKANINFGFLQAQYQPFRIDQDRNPWNIGLGVNIPVFNPNKGDMTKRKLEVIEAEGDLSDAEDEQQAGQTLMKSKIQTLTNRYQSLQDQFDSLNVESLGNALQDIKNSNPFAAVKLKRNLIQLKGISARLKKEIYLAYIEYLAYTDVLQQLPLKNHLVLSVNPPIDED